MAEWIKFTEVDLRDNRLTKVWAVWTIDGQHLLGRVGWYSPWRKYAFIPTPGEQIVLEEQCLRDIAAFIGAATELRKIERKTQRTTKETTV